MSDLTPEDQKLIDAIRARIREPNRATLAAEKFGFHTPLYPPASLTEVLEAEAALGFELPTLIREIYLQVGNGGFGPGYGIYGLANGCHHLNNYSLVDFTLLTRSIIGREEELGFLPDELEEWLWQPYFIQYCYWGCNVNSIVDCGNTDLPVYVEDGFYTKPHSSPTLRKWWQEWLDGVVEQY